ncbi:probable tyrosyl-DNA phosphodiesterase isoform X2 [Artemia franciscana]|uniref:probable tyrosyl-DNA phosphodiesterase isoform X2 n=1 Tax=Artemia franciscana TaxID=6661 RepID=UPI0032DB5FC0
MSDPRPSCSYGKKCYRRNPDHFKEYKHSHIEKAFKNDDLKDELSTLQKIQLGIVQSLANEGSIQIDSNEPEADQSKEENMQKKVNPRSQDENGESPLQKKKKLDEEERKVSQIQGHGPAQLKDIQSSSASALQASGFRTVLDKWKSAAPFHLFLSKIAHVERTHEEPLTLSFSDILDPSMGNVVESVQINYMCSPGWLLAQYCVHNLQKTQITVFYGSENPEVEAVASKVPTLTAVRLKPKYLFGQHHTKMCLLYYDDQSMRVVVHTGNLYENDWEDRTQGLWISPRCYTGKGDMDSATFFRRDLISYLNTYEQPKLINKWIERLNKLDMSEIRVFLIGSVPGNHAEKSFGHPRLATLLRLHTTQVAKPEDWKIVAQCSSIGSLGPQPKAWFQGEFATALSTAGSQGPKLGLVNSHLVELIYPSYSDVKSSLHGLAGGGCLPYSRKTHSNQTWLTDYLK